MHVSRARGTSFFTSTLLLLLAAVAETSACGSSNGGTSVFTPDGGNASDASFFDATANGDSGDAQSSFPIDGAVLSLADAACPVVCGVNGTCCAGDQACYNEACVATCSTGIYCGEGSALTCCNTGDVCLSDTCVTPTTACADSFDCADNEFCEPTLGKCLPQPTGGDLCIVKPSSAFDPIVKWSWTDSTIHPGYNQVINMPVVVDLDGDSTPDVVIVTSKSLNQGEVAYLRALDGKTGLEKWGANADVYSSSPDYTVSPRSTPAVADLDGDGTPEIVAFGRNGGIIAFDHNGMFLWKSTKSDGGAPYTGNFLSNAIAIADMDNDGYGEIVAGGVILDHTGKLVSDTFIGRELYGANDITYGAISVVADVAPDAGAGNQYVVSGNRAYDKFGNVLWDKSSGPDALPDGYPAIADLDKDGKPELVVVFSAIPDGGVRRSFVRVQDATTGEVIAGPFAAPGSGRGGPPTIADFDGDGYMDFSSANGDHYNVFKYNLGTPPTITSLWSSPTQDISSNVTGSSVFDFQGDGIAEVVYNDECYSRVFNGADGSVEFQIPNSTGTIHEYPVIVDVDGDNHTEYVVAANDVNYTDGGCPLFDAGSYTARHGVFVYADANNKWVRTRKIWNEHAYHITNITSNDQLPRPEDLSWGPNGLNNYRVSSQGKGVFNAPDLAVDLQVSTLMCPSNLELLARVKNIGSLGVAAGVTVDFYLGTSASGQLLGQTQTTEALLPGQSQVVTLAYAVGSMVGPFSFYVTVNGGDGDAGVTSTIDSGASGSGSGSVAECNDANNSAVAGNVSCPKLK